jgi:hypothetical protein
MMPDSTIARSTRGTPPRNLLRLLGSAEAHHPFDPGAVVPAAVEDDDLARRRKVADVALQVHLAFLAFGRCRQRDDTEDARTHPLGDRLDGAALAGAVAPFEDDADLEPLVHHPLLQLDQFHVEALELLFVSFFAQRFCRGFACLNFPADFLARHD